jgi:lipopolysaccharide transport system permease protein
MEELVVEAGRIERQYWKDIWRYRELFYFLAWRDFLVRYKQTLIGIAWGLIRPVLSMVVFTIVFGTIARLPSDGMVPYSILVYAAMLPWQFFSTALTEASNSLISNPNLVSKIYFPRLIVPASSVITTFSDFLISFSILVLMMGWYQFVPDWRLLTLPVFVALGCAAAFGSGLWLCALNVKYRDFRYVVPFVVQFGLYISPVGFSSALIPQTWRLAYSLNPMVGVIDGFRWALLRGEAQLYWPGLLASVAVSTVVCASGLWYFRRAESAFADVI